MENKTHEAAETSHGSHSRVSQDELNQLKRQKKRGATLMQKKRGATLIQKKRGATQKDVL